jgi:hypothetical protein
VLLQVLRRASIVVPGDHAHGAVVDGAERGKNVLLDVLAVGVDGAFELSAGVLVPAGRLREVGQVADLEDFIGLPAPNEVDERFELARVFVGGLNVGDDDDAVQSVPSSSSVLTCGSGTWPTYR